MVKSFVFTHNSRKWPLMLFLCFAGVFSAAATASASNCGQVFFPFSPKLANALRGANPQENLGQPRSLKDSPALEVGDVFSNSINASFWVVEKAEEISGRGRSIQARKLFANTSDSPARSHYNPEGKLWNFYQNGSEAKFSILASKVGRLGEVRVGNEHGAGVQANPTIIFERLKVGDVFSSAELANAVYPLKSNAQGMIVPDKRFITLDTRYGSITNNPSVGLTGDRLYVRGNRQDFIRVDARDESRMKAKFIVIATETSGSGGRRQDRPDDVHGVWAVRLPTDGTIKLNSDGSPEGELLFIRQAHGYADAITKYILYGNVLAPGGALPWPM